MTTMRIIEEAALRERVREAEAFEAVERAFTALGRDQVVQPPPMAFDFSKASGEVHVKGAYIEGAPLFAIKVASGFYRNPEKNLPSSSGLVLVFDASTGFPLALFQDNAYLTEIRTAAAGALAAKLLAPVAIEKMAVVGSGAQARYQLRAITRVREIGHVTAWSPTAAHRERYCSEMEAELGVPFSPAPSAAAAVRGAALVLTVTTARKPVVASADVADAATVIAVGSDGPDKQELEGALVARADKVVADRLSQCVRLGEIHHAVANHLMSEDDVYAELGEIVVGAKKGRENDELILCDLTGVGAQDAAIAEVAWRAFE